MAKKTGARPQPPPAVGDVSVYVHEPGIGHHRAKILRENAEKLGFAVLGKFELGRTSHVVLQRSLRALAADLRTPDLERQTPGVHFVDPRWLVACAKNRCRADEAEFAVREVPPGGAPAVADAGASRLVPMFEWPKKRPHEPAAPAKPPPRAGEDALEPSRPSGEDPAAVGHATAEDFFSCSLALEDPAPSEPSQATQSSQATWAAQPPPPPPPLPRTHSASQGGPAVSASQALFGELQSAFVSPPPGAGKRRRKFRFGDGEWVPATPSPAKGAGPSLATDGDPSDGFLASDALAYGFLAAAAPLLLPPPSSPPPARHPRLDCEPEPTQPDAEAEGPSRAAALLARYLGFTYPPAQIVHAAALFAAREDEDHVGSPKRSLQETAAAVWRLAGEARAASEAHQERLRRREAEVALQDPDVGTLRRSPAGADWHSRPAPRPEPTRHFDASIPVGDDFFAGGSVSDHTSRWPGPARRWYPRVDEGGATAKPLVQGADPTLLITPWAGVSPQSKYRRPAKELFESNIKIAEVLLELKDLHEARKMGHDGFRAYSLTRAAGVIKNLPFEVLAGHDLRPLRYIGNGVAEKVDEIIATGTLQRIRNLTASTELSTVKLFQTVWGIGPVSARQLYGKGYRTLEDLIQHRDELSTAQQIGLRHYDDILKRIPRAEVARIENEVRIAARKIDPNFSVVCCGSYRRGKADCGDCDVLVSHPDGIRHMGALGPILETLTASGFLTDTLSLSTDETGLPPGSDAPRLTTQHFFGICRLPDDRGGLLPHRRLDIIVVPYDHWPCSLLYFTGSGLFNRRMRLKARTLGMCLSEKTVRRVSRDKKMVIIAEEPPFHVEREEDVFRVLEMKYEPPQNRSLG